jgi:hypothetical protein
MHPAAVQSEGLLEPTALFGKGLCLATYIRPFHVDIANSSGHLRHVQKIESFQKHTPLQIGVKRDAKVMAHRPRQKNSAGHFDLLRYISSDGTRDRGNTPRFNRTLDQSDELMADRSSGHQQGGIGLLFQRNRIGDPVRDRVFEPLWIHVVTR